MGYCEIYRVSARSRLFHFGFLFRFFHAGVIGGSMEITGKNGVITGDGKLETTGKNLSITSETGDINIGGDLDVRQDLTLKTGGDGEITLYKDKKVHEVMNILAGRNISLQTENGLILVEGKIVSKSGSITAETETGEIFLKKNNNHKESR